MSQTPFDYEKVTWGGGELVSPDTMDFLDHSLHLKYALQALQDIRGDVIELGCGSARFIASIAKARPDLHCYGSDISETALKEANHRQHVRFCHGDATDLPFEDEKFNAVMMIDVLEHLPDIDMGLSEAHRILKRDGVFHLVFPCEDHPFSLHGHLHFLQRFKRDHAGHIQQISPKELVTHIEKSGLEITQIRHSYHLLGQIYDSAVFSALAMGIDVHGARHAYVETAPQGEANQSRLGKWVGRTRALVSKILYLESTLLAKVPTGMTVHLTARRRD